VQKTHIEGAIDGWLYGVGLHSRECMEMRLAVTAAALGRDWIYSYQLVPMHFSLKIFHDFSMTFHDIEGIFPMAARRGATMHRFLLLTNSRLRNKF